MSIKINGKKAASVLEKKILDRFYLTAIFETISAVTKH